MQTVLAIILQWAVIQASAVYMQQSPDYESANVSQTSMGKVVEVLDTEGYWTKIRTPEPYEGWVNTMCLAFMTEEEKDAYIAAPKYICVEEYTHVYSGQSLKSEPVSDLLMGDIIRKGDMETRLWAEVILPSGQKAWVKDSKVRDFTFWARSYGFSREKEKKQPEPTAANIVAVAKRFLGSAYVWGGMSVKGFDCSGLAGFAYFMNGILLPRDAKDQVRCGVSVPVEEMQAGDLVFFGETKVSHVGICTAPGKIIHSSQIVRSNSLDSGSADYYGRNIIAVRRILGHVDTGEGAISIINSPLYFKQEK